MEVGELSDRGVPQSAVDRIQDKGITELNPPQVDAVEQGLLDGESLVVSSPTASGKTMIATLAISKLLDETDRKALYLVPLKALGSEKYRDYQEFFDGEDVDVALSVGDRDSSADYVETKDLIIMTVEKLDAVLRHSPSWISQVGLVVVDEIHLLNSERRGPTLEVTLTRLQELLDFQLLGLSATISNSDRLAEWLDAELVESDYRPVDLKEGVYHDGSIHFYHGDDQEDESSDGTNSDDGRESEFVTGREKLDEERGEEDGADVEELSIAEGYGAGTLNVLDDTLSRGNQAITFVRSRKSAESEAERAGKAVPEHLSREEEQELAELADRVETVLGSPTEQCRRLADCVRDGAAFHHAGLLSKQRALLEEAFRDGLLKSIAATPTLAAGVSLPAYRIIIRDVKRYTDSGLDYIPVLEFKQMCLPPDEEVLLADGRKKRIGEIVEEGEGTEVLSYNLDSQQLESKPIRDTYKREAETLVEIETETGTFTLTPEHPVLTGGDLWKDAGELEEGDVLSWKSSPDGTVPYFWELLPSEGVYIPDGSEILEEYKTATNLNDIDIAEALDISAGTMYHYKTGKKSVPLDGLLRAMEYLEYDEEKIAEKLPVVKSRYGNPIQLPERLSKDFLWLVGLIITDGNLNRQEDRRTGSVYTAIRIFNTNEDIIERAKSVFGELGLSVHQEEREGTYRLEVGNTLLARMLHDRFSIPYGKKADRTRIPDVVFQLPEEHRGAFLEGVFDGDGSFTRSDGEGDSFRVLFSTSSQEFAKDLQSLLSSLSIKSKIREVQTEPTVIRGEERSFSGSNYNVVFRSKGLITRFSEIVNPVKTDIPHPSYTSYHNVDSFHRDKLNSAEVKSVDTINDSQSVYNLEVADNNNYITASGTVLHNCGRAGRPEHHDEGHAVAIAGEKGEREEIRDRYIYGESETIYSKLAVEPVLRMHALGLVATGFAASFEQLTAFFESTFYAYQYGETDDIVEKLESVVGNLEEYGFVEADEGELAATTIGERVAELYIDPYTADHLLQHMEQAEEQGGTDLAWLHSLSQTVEMKPRFRVRGSEEADVEEMLAEAEEELFDEPPAPWDMGYDQFLEALKTGMCLKEWVEEVDEDELMERYNVTPGGIRSKVEQADWLLYACSELATLKEWSDAREQVQKLRTRVKHGIREELLPLVRFDQVGRVRARALHDDGITTAGDIRDADFNHLKNLVGKRTAENLKGQVGQDNVFDKENILDYMSDG